MGVPGPAIPAHNLYRVHFSGFEASFHAATEALLKPLKVSVGRFDSEKGDSPGDDFWKTTLAVISGDGDSSWLRQHSLDKYLLVAVTFNDNAGQHADCMRTPDLWLVQAKEPDALNTVAGNWIDQGAGAVVVFHPTGVVHWISRNAAFGQSHGQLNHGSKTSATYPGSFTAGLVQALIEELLGENLFDKTSISVDRECLEMLPLHLSRAAESGLAAHQVFTEGHSMTLLQKKGDALGKVRQQLHAWRGPEPLAWGARGR